MSAPALDEAWFSDFKRVLSERFGIVPQAHDIYLGACKFSVTPYFERSLQAAGPAEQPAEVLYQAWLAQSSEAVRQTHDKAALMAFYAQSPVQMAMLLVQSLVEEYQLPAWRHGVTLCASTTGRVTAPQPEDAPQSFDFYLIAIPAWVPLLVIEKLHGHFGGDEAVPHGAAEFIALMSQIDSETPFMISRADRYLSLRFIDPVPHPAGLIELLSDYNSDLVDQGEGFEEVVARLRDDRSVTMWWD